MIPHALSVYKCNNSVHNVADFVASYIMANPCTSMYRQYRTGKSWGKGKIAGRDLPTALHCTTTGAIEHVITI